MFRSIDAFGSSEVGGEVGGDSGSTLIDQRHHESSDGSNKTAFGSKVTPHRIAELVHHLGDVPMSEARRAVRRTGQTCGQHDPLSIVAAALVELRRNSRRCINA